MTKALMNKPQWIKIIALSGALSVALGAFAAHGLQDSLSETYLQTFRTAVLYQFLHTIALLALVSLPDSALKEFLAGYFAVFRLTLCPSVYRHQCTGYDNAPRGSSLYLWLDAAFHCGPND